MKDQVTMSALATNAGNQDHEDRSMDLLEQDLEQMERHHRELQDAAAKIEFQLNEASSKARTTGVYSDGQWYNSARYALRKKRQQAQDMMKTMGDIRKMIRRGRHTSENRHNFEWWFLQAATELLTEETIENIRSLALAKMERRDDGQTVPVS